ncbi:MAG: helix-turn-helix transcriptional regulator [Eubacteriales bacterium]|nr:helix-turn-helix transcriptional regulator [Eubacteriales bacterium]
MRFFRPIFPIRPPSPLLLPLLPFLLAAITRLANRLKEHWREKYDAREAANAANLSPNHFQRLFKKHAGITSRDYYMSVKIRKLQEHLKDESLSISEAFSECGIDYHGYFAGLFRKKVGMSPTQYRRMLKEEKTK